MERIVLIIDIGTQSVRSMLINQAGDIKTMEKRSYKYVVDNGYIEFDADEIFMIILKQLVNLHNRNIRDYAKIEGVSITSQRDTFVVVDRRGNPLRRCISWMDRRKAKNYPRPSFFHEIAFKVTKMSDVKKSLMEDTRFYWIEENERDIFERTYKYLSISAYIAFKFTGKFKDSDASTVGHIPFDYKNRKWDDFFSVKGQLFQIDEKLLWRVVGSTNVIGKIKDEICERLLLKKGTNLYASGSDKTCETAGVGAIDEKTASISLGSQTTLQINSNKYYELDKFVSPFCSVIPGYYNPEVIIYRGFWMIKWFIENFAKEEEIYAKAHGISTEEVLNKKLNDIPAGSDGLVLNAYWGQEILRPNAKGSIIGFSDKHTRLHMYKAIIEGLFYGLKEGILKMEKKSKIKIESVALSAGGSKSDEICQLCSDILGKRVYTIQTHEASALGAAMAVFVGRGVYRDFFEAKHEMLRIKKEYEPIGENYAVYKSIYKNAYSKVYPSLKGIYNTK